MRSWSAAAVMLCALASGCATVAQGPVHELAPHRLIAELNRNAALVGSIETNYVEARIYLAEHMLIGASLDGKLRFAQPGLFRLRLEHSLQGVVADAGSTAQAWWLHLPQPDGDMYLGKVGVQPVEGDLPMQADEVAWALGVMPVAGPGVEVGRRQDDYLVRLLEPALIGLPRVKRDFLVDGRTLAVKRFRSYYADGKVKMVAEMSEHADLGSAPGQGLPRNVYMPTRIQLNWGKAGYLRLKLQYLKVGFDQNPVFFTPPEDVDGRVIVVE